MAVDREHYYFGWTPSSGHGWTPGPGADRGSEGAPREFPFRHLDGLFAPYVDGKEIEGAACHFQVHGPQHHGRHWTVISFFDRSGDKRGASNTSFVVSGQLSFDEMVAAARAAFPKIWERIDGAGIDVVKW